jgi:hypothetical protein
MKRDTCRQNSLTFIAKFLPASLLGVSATTRAESSVDESGVSVTQIRGTIDQKMVAVAWDALYDTTP